MRHKCRRITNTNSVTNVEQYDPYGSNNTITDYINMTA